MGLNNNDSFKHSAKAPLRFEEAARQSMYDTRNNIRQSTRDFNQETHNSRMVDLEQEKLKVQKEFNDMYKKKIEDLERGARGDHIRAWISIFISFVAVIASALSVVISFLVK